MLFKAMVEELELFESMKTTEIYEKTNIIPKELRIQRMCFLEEEIILMFLYPRMDHNVSTMKNHLLKLPFSVHPKTNNISIPISEEKIDEFNPKECVTLKSLIGEI